MTRGSRPWRRTAGPHSYGGVTGCHGSTPASSALSTGPGTGTPPHGTNVPDLGTRERGVLLDGMSDTNLEIRRQMYISNWDQ